LSTLHISRNKTAKIILKNKNCYQFLFIVKAAVLKEQISKFYPQILSTEDSLYIYKMVKTGQFTTKCKGNKVIALKLQKLLWWDSA